MAQNSIFQFKVTLKEIEPAIWRRIQISGECTFWDLHVAIQDAMGWKDCHLHHFELIDSVTHEKQLMGIPDDERIYEDSTLAGWKYQVKNYIAENKRMLYVYDYGDNWQHLVEFEGQYDKDEKMKYPICLAGECACPPEDVGSVPGYYNFLEIIRNPRHEEYKSMLEWIGKKYDPEEFDHKKVKFDNPRKRWSNAFK